MATSKRETSQRPIILIVDDDLGIRSLAKVILERFDLEPLIASTGEEALIAVSQICPDLILLDIGLPDCNGYQLADKFKAIPKLKPIPIIFLSGRTPAEDGGQSFAHGGALFLRKPFTQSQLKEVVLMALAASQST